MPRRLLAGVLVLLALLPGACSKDHEMDEVVNPVDPDRTGVEPPVPVSVDARIGNRQIELDWSLRDSSHVASISKYRIYRATPEGTPVLSDSVAQPPAVIQGLENGVAYRFTVSTVLDNLLEGRRSDPVTAVPGLYSVLIENGRERVNSTQVRLSLQAPEGTEGMKIANTPALDDVPVQPYQSSLNWRVEPGEGSKTVYVRFVDGAGNESRTVSDTVFLDTRAEIRSVTFSPETALPGEEIHFRLDAGETDGTARVELGDERTLDLRDDGSGGDAVADDGIYELDYTVDEDLSLVDARVTGRFTDEAGNQADERVAPGRLTVHQDPAPVTLRPITSPGPRELFLEWTQAPDADRFDAYRIFRSRTPGVDTSGTRVQVREITTRTTTTFTDGSLDPDQTYYYRVYVVDEAGFSTPSNEESARPRRSPPPEPVTLQPPTAVSEESVTLSWTRSLAPDFDAYRVYRGEQPDLDNDPELRLLTSQSSSGNTTYTDDDDLKEGTTYYYRVDVVDDAGGVGKSNVVSADIPDLPPDDVTLNRPESVGETSILLTWERSRDLDFDRYELRRSASSGVTGSSPLVATFEEARQTSYLDQNLRENTDYYYRVFVVDEGGNITGSNELKVTTENDDPSSVSLVSLTEVSGVTPSVRVQWTNSSAHDFESYNLYRDTSPAVGTGSELIRTVADQDVLSYVDSGLEDNTRYYYRVFVEDDAGGEAGSNEESIVTANRPPTPVTLRVEDTSSTSITLTWTENDNHDFDEYRLLQGTTSSTFPVTIATFFQREQTIHTIYYADSDTTRYFFKVVVYDEPLGGGSRMSTDSNVVSARPVEE